MKLTLIQHLAGCCNARVWRGTWGEFDLRKPYDSLRWRALHRWEWLCNWPLRLRWALADRLCRWASRLRKHRVHEGWYGLKGNVAEMISQNIHEYLIGASGDDGKAAPITLDGDEIESMRNHAERLAALARATYWHDQ